MIGSIYKISSPNCIECYIGSFNNNSNTLNRRFSVHKHISNTCKSKYIIDKGDAIIELIEEYEYNSKLELEQREQQLINQLKQQGIIFINKNRSGINVKQNINSYFKQYREEHKEEIKEQKKQYNKQYAQEHKEELKAYQKNWRQRNLRTNS
jgi:F0F1-type ATP synthase alpha subunit